MLNWLSKLKCINDSGCNAAVCDAVLGYCRLGHYAGLYNSSWISDNTWSGQTAMFRVKESISCKGLHLLSDSFPNLIYSLYEILFYYVLSIFSRMFQGRHEKKWRKKFRWFRQRNERIPLSSKMSGNRRLRVLCVQKTYPSMRFNKYRCNSYSSKWILVWTKILLMFFKNNMIRYFLINQ